MFLEKPFEPVKAIRRDDIRKVPGKFEGEPTYQGRVSLPTLCMHLGLSGYMYVSIDDYW